MNIRTTETTITNKLNSLDVDSLFEVIKKLAIDTRTEADLIFNKAIDVLMSKTTEQQFLNKMDLLDSLI